MLADLFESLSILEVSAPVRVERVSVQLHLNVSPYGSFAGISQPSHHRAIALCVRASEYSERPPASSKPMPVSLCDPASGLIWMAVFCPSPEREPEDRLCFPIRRSCHDMTVIVCPAPDNWVEQPYQALLLRGAILTNHVAYLYPKKRACSFWRV